MALEEIKVVDKRGQLSLGKRFAGKRLRVEHRDNGSIVLTAVIVVPKAARWTSAEPHRSRIDRGISWAMKHPPSETNLEALAEKARRRARP